MLGLMPLLVQVPNLSPALLLPRRSLSDDQAYDVFELRRLATCDAELGAAQESSELTDAVESDHRAMAPVVRPVRASGDGLEKEGPETNEPTAGIGREVHATTVAPVRGHAVEARTAAGRGRRPSGLPPCLPCGP